jgi:phosphatidylglycerol:prolipoprotein diacylglycerol transferase
MNGDAFGVPFAARTIMRWPWLEFFIFKPGTPAALEYGGKPLHPAMLYELLGCLIIFGFLWWLRGGNYKEGFLISVYLISYSVLRFGVEFFRGDSLWLVPDMVKAAWVISFLIVLSFSWLIYRKRLWQPVAAPKPRPKAKPKPKLKEGS